MYVTKITFFLNFQDGRTAIHYSAANTASKRLYSVLANKGADHTVKDNFGQNTTYYAGTFIHSTQCTMLQKISKCEVNSGASTGFGISFFTNFSYTQFQLM